VVPPEATQDEAYDTLMYHQLKSFFTFEKAYNVLYFAYGQTGTGKTHSIFGPKYSLKQTDDMSQ
jgi:DNA replication protein DnaC